MATDERRIDRLFLPVDMASLAAFRIAFGALMLVLVTRYFAHGWIDIFYTQPRLFLSYAGLEWIQPWSGRGMAVHFAMLGLCAAGIMLGAWTRSCSALFCVGFTYVHLIDKTNYLNHYYLISLISGLLAILPTGSVWSIDAWRRGIGRRTGPAWTVWLLRYQLALVYAFAGLAKVSPDWIWDAQPLRIWLAGSSDLPIVGSWLTMPFTAYIASYAGLAFDIGIVPALLWRRTRAVAYVAVVVFHIGTAALFPIGIFPWLMIGLTPIFFDPSWPRRLRFGATSRTGDATVAETVRRAPDVRRELRWATACALGAYVALQAAVPFRSLPTSGEMLWTEEGFRFGWRVMLMEKYGEAEFRITDDRGRTRRVDPRAHLTPLQYRMMTTQPDMIVDFAHWLARHEAHRGTGPVEVRADVVTSLNGRPPRALIDPSVDLAQVTYRRGQNDWITKTTDPPNRIETDMAWRGVVTERVENLHAAITHESRTQP